MEGITNYAYREAHRECFPGIDRYYSPFIAANQTYSMKTREKEDTAPEHNSGVVLVPQILTNNADVFLWSLRQMSQRGWTTVNLNLGCPSATVFTHGKGAGFLADPSRLDAFFEQVFEGLAAWPNSDTENPVIPPAVTVKTRIGIEDASEAPALLAVFNRYPIAELIVHPRLRKDFYKGEPDFDTYQLFYEEYRDPLTYNGDICSPADLRSILARFPDTARVMIGRGLITNPALVRILQGGPALTAEELMHFHDEVYTRQKAAMGSFQNTVGKMKELWYYMGSLFPSPDSARLLKAVKKARTETAYLEAARELCKQI